MAEPTAQPTPQPSANPTTEPTANPTAEPSANPTAEPTPQPTAEPSANPTPVPTANPTETPTMPLELSAVEEELGCSNAAAIQLTPQGILTDIPDAETCKAECDAF